MINNEKVEIKQTLPFSNKKRKILASVMFIFGFFIFMGLYVGKIYPFNVENSNSTRSNTTPNTDSVTNNNTGIVDNKSVDNNTTTTGAVTITNVTCTISDNRYFGLGFGTEAARCKSGDKFAYGYAINLSGTMTGPEGAIFSIKTSPSIPTIAGKEVFSCGGWEQGLYPNDCERKTDSNTVTAQWSLTEPTVAGEYINLNPNMQVTINAEVKDSMYGKLLDSATRTVSCPTVNYCIK